MSTQELRNKILEMAECHEKSYNPATGKYSLSLYDMSVGDEWSFPVYLLLDSWWNDAIAWAKGEYDENPTEKRTT